MSSSLITGNLRTAPWVACNIYISAGRPYYFPILNELLLETVQHCRRLRLEAATQQHQMEISIKESSKIVLVHAYADVPYNRSSFHFAGHGSAIAQVVSNLAIQAFNRLLPHIQQEEVQNSTADSSSSTRHPFVGLVDHISILPLNHSNNSLQQQQHSTSSSSPISFDSKDILPEAKTATYIATTLQKKGVHVLTYGSAHPQQHSLAMIRKTQTNFFQSSNPSSTTPHSPTSTSSWGTCTVGSPMGFVENVNIRLSSSCTLQLAQSLTRKIRGRNVGGIPGVEALTLPYSHGRWEVACNLLQPQVGSMEYIQQVCTDWELENGHVIESIYRVGTTEDQCLHVLNDIQEEEEITKHETGVVNRFQTFILS